VVGKGWKTYLHDSRQKLVGRERCAVRRILLVGCGGLGRRQLRYQLVLFLLIFIFF
jgi:hypothetical protein